MPNQLTMSPGNQPAIFLRSHWYTSFEESLSAWSWGETYWAMHKELPYSALHRTDQFPLKIARARIKHAPFPSVCPRMVITLRSTLRCVQDVFLCWVSCSLWPAGGETPALLSPLLLNKAPQLPLELAVCRYLVWVSSAAQTAFSIVCKQ